MPGQRSAAPPSGQLPPSVDLWVFQNVAPASLPVGLNLIIYGGRYENLFGRLRLVQKSNLGFPCCIPGREIGLAFRS